MFMNANNILASAHVLENYQECNYEAALLGIDQLNQKIPFNQQVVDAWRAYFCMLLGKFDEAKKHLDKAQLQDTAQNQFYAIKGHWHLIHGDVKAAIECYHLQKDKKSMEDDFRHIEMVFGIKPPRWQ